jgi:tight adherence protein B
VGVALLVFLTVSLGIAAGYQLLSGWLFPDAARIRERLAEEFGKDGGQASASPLFKNLDRLSLEPVPSQDVGLGNPRPTLLQPGFHGRLITLLEQANLLWTPQQVLTASGGLSLVLGLAGTLFWGPLAGLPLAMGGALAPWIYLRVRWKKRREKYLKQLPNAFELMARVIRAGQSVPQALQAVADAFEDPLASEFANCQKQQNLGLTPEIAFQEMAQRSGILEMRIFAMAMLIQRQTGGNLSEILERLGGLVRARLKLKQQVRTLTAEGRMQGWTLVVLPFLALGVMMVVNRQYAEVLFQHGGLLAGMVLAMSIGVMWIRNIVNIES